MHRPWTARAGRPQGGDPSRSRRLTQAPRTARLPLVKRLLDRAAAALALVVTAPLLAAAAGLVAIDSIFCRRDRGPLLYRERRVSGSREFDLLKLRVLRQDAIAGALRAFGQVRPAERDIANLTWAGRVLKRFYLDELPQLWNVLRGDMSLVGPRPWPPPMVEEQERQGLVYR
ncbi:MAG: sugar transferase, partial [Thermoleophilia bacterium]